MKKEMREKITNIEELKSEIKRLEEMKKELKRQEKELLNKEEIYEMYQKCNGKYEFIGWGKPLNEETCVDTKVRQLETQTNIYKKYLVKYLVKGKADEIIEIEYIIQ